MSPDTIGCVRTGEFYSYTLRVDRKIFQCDKKKLRIEIYQVTCGRGLQNLCQLRSDIQTASIAQNMITIYQRDLVYLSFFRSANIQEHKNGGNSTDTVTSNQVAHTLTFLKKYLIFFAISWKVGLIKEFSI